MDAPPAGREASVQTHRKVVTPTPAPPTPVRPPAAAGGAELTLVYQMDEVRQGTGPMRVSEIAQSVLAEPYSRHRVYHEKSWKDAASVPEIAEHLPPEDDIPDDIPPDN